MNAPTNRTPEYRAGERLLTVLEREIALEKSLAAARALNARLCEALESAVLELSAIEHGLLGPEHAVRRNGCARVGQDCRSALSAAREVTP